MKNDVVRKKLTSLCRPKQWKTIPGKNLLPTGYPVFGANGIIGYWSEYNHEEETLLIACRGTCGTVTISSPKSYVNGNAMCLDHLSDEVLLKYLFYYLNSYDFSKIITGTTIPQITIEGLNKVDVPVPPINEQKKLISLFDKLSDCLSLRRAQLSSLDALVKSRFAEMFGDMSLPTCPWEKHKLVDVCMDSDDIKCGPFGTQLSKDEYTESGVAVWEIPQINSEFQKMPTHYVTPEKASLLSAYDIKPGDIAMSRKGNVGRCAVFPADFDCGIIHSDVLRIRVDPSKVSSEFMMRQLHYSRAIQHQIHLVSAGAIMAGINVTKLKQILVHVPPLALQHRFAAFVARVERLKTSIQRAFSETQRLFDSQLQKHFGEN